MGIAYPHRSGGRGLDVDEERVAAHVAGVGHTEDGAGAKAAVDEGEGAVRVVGPVVRVQVGEVEGGADPGGGLDDFEVGDCHLLEEDEGWGCWGEAEDEGVQMGYGGFHAGGRERGLEVDVPGEEFDGWESRDGGGGGGEGLMAGAGYPEIVLEDIESLGSGVEEVSAVHFSRRDGGGDGRGWLKTVFEDFGRNLLDEVHGDCFMRRLAA